MGKQNIVSSPIIFKISGKKIPNLEFVVKKNFSQEFTYV